MIKRVPFIANTKYAVEVGCNLGREVILSEDIELNKQILANSKKYKTKKIANGLGTTAGAVATVGSLFMGPIGLAVFYGGILTTFAGAGSSVLTMFSSKDVKKYTPLVEEKKNQVLLVHNTLISTMKSNKGKKLKLVGIDIPNSSANEVEPKYANTQDELEYALNMDSKFIVVEPSLFREIKQKSPRLEGAGIMYKKYIDVKNEKYYVISRNLNANTTLVKGINLNEVLIMEREII